MTMRKWLTAMSLMLVVASGCALATQNEKPGTLHSTYIGTQGGFAVHRIEMPQPNFTVELLQSDGGDRVLLVTNLGSGESQTFVLPERARHPRNDDSVSIQTEVTVEPILVRSDGSGFYAVFVDGELVGFLTISSDGTFTFTTKAK